MGSALGIVELAYVAGRAPSEKPWEHLLVALQLYLDESDSGKSRNKRAYVLAGYAASAEAWARLSAEWEPLAQSFTKRGPNGKRRFKMAEMQNRMADVAAFYDVIVRNVLIAVSMTIFEHDLENAIDRIWSDNTNIILGPDIELKNIVKILLIHAIYRAFDDISCNELTEGSSSRAHSAIRNNRGRLDLIFDEDTGVEWLSGWWDDFVGKTKYDRDLFGAHPRFDNDEDLPPLQAADFLAWWVRKAFESDSVADLGKGVLFPWNPSKTVPMLSYSLTEDLLTYNIMQFLQADTIGTKNIYDNKRKPRNEFAIPVTRARTHAKAMRHFEQVLKLLRGRPRS